MASKSKAKVVFVCADCGAESAKWQGKCQACGEYNTIKEMKVSAENKDSVAFKQGYAGAGSSAPKLLCDADDSKIIRISTGLSEFDRVLGKISVEREGIVEEKYHKGLVLGSTVLIGGFPGAGKSTLLLQTACNIAAAGEVVIYFSGEESASQIKDRAQRLDLRTDQVLCSTSTNVVEIANQVDLLGARVIIVDSIQSVYHPEFDGAPGGTAQLKSCAIYLNNLAKDKDVTIIMVGQILKDDALAGPRMLMHIVDAVLMLSSTDDNRFRILQADGKNRYGTTDESGFFTMTAQGMKVVDNPSAIFLSRGIEDAPGSVVVPLWAGTRPMLVEVQALVDLTTLSNPRRVAVGLDEKKLSVLLAVLSKHAGLTLLDQDVYASVVGGIKVNETSAELALLLATISSYRNRSIHSKVIAFGEVGLLGEVRPCPFGKERLREAAKLDFKKAIIPWANRPKEPIDGLEIYPVATLAQAIQHLDDLNWTD